MTFLSLILVLAAGILPGGKASLEALQPRDSVLVADQFEYGVRLDSVETGTVLMFQDLGEYPVFKSDSLVLVRDWKIDTLRQSRNTADITAKVRLAPFEEGSYELPVIAVMRVLPNGQTDTLLFEPAALEVVPIPVDTATFVINDLKGQMRYPLTFKELLPYIIGALLLAALIVLVVFLVRRYSRKADGSDPDEPPYLRALRELDRYRDARYDAPELQKAYYSGLTDTLKNYIVSRFPDIDALEMTTAELFAALKGRNELTPQLYSDSKDLFELADFVKFAKHTATKDENRKSMQTAVGFVTSTYQIELEEERKSDVL